MKLRRPWLGLLLASLLFTGCAAQVKPHSGAAIRKGSPIENALAYNASLADANKTLADAVIAAQKDGLISQADASNITSAQFTVADADKQITAILQGIAVCLASPANPAMTTPKNCAGNAGQLTTLIERIQTNVNVLVFSRDIGIKDAKTQQAVKTAMATITQMAELILSTLHVAGLIQ